MLTTSRFFMAPVLLLGGWLGLAGPAPAQVRDNAHLFSDGAVVKADREIADIRRSHKVEVLVETFARVPEGREKELQEDKDRFFNSWARERARDEAVRGIYLLVCKDPGRVEVEVGNKTQEKAFTP